jgi:hypothetical protein
MIYLTFNSTIYTKSHSTFKTAFLFMQAFVLMILHILRMEMKEIACLVSVTLQHKSMYYIEDLSVLRQTTLIVIVYYYEREEQLRISCLHI